MAAQCGKLERGLVSTGKVCSSKLWSIFLDCLQYQCCWVQIQDYVGLTQCICPPETTYLLDLAWLSHIPRGWERGLKSPWLPRLLRHVGWVQGETWAGDPAVHWVSQLFSSKAFSLEILALEFVWLNKAAHDTRFTGQHSSLRIVALGEPGPLVRTQLYLEHLLL